MPEETSNTPVQELIKRHHIPKEFLQPDVYLFSCLFLPPDVHQAFVDRTPVDESKILSKDTVVGKLAESIALRDFTFLGVDHSSYRDHEAIAYLLSKMTLTDCAIAIEYPPRLQSKIDLFLETGKFQEQDDPTQYPKIYKSSQRVRNVGEIPENLQGTFFDEFPDLDQIYPVLLAARAKKAKVLCIDPMGELQEMRTQESENAMFELLSSGSEKHLIVIAGANHTKREGYVEQDGRIDSLRQLAEQTGKHSLSFYFDSLQTIHYDWQTNQVTESVLHKALTQKADKQGIKENIIGYVDPDIEEKLHAEVYVAVR